MDNDLFSEIVSISAAGLLVVDASGPGIEIVYANPTYETASGFEADELVGTSWLSYLAVDEGSQELIRLKQSMAAADAQSLSLPFIRKDGDIWLGRMRLTPLKHSGDERRLVLVEHRSEERPAVEDAELMKRALGIARKRIASLDRTDAVTGLMSRTQFSLMLKREIAVARREERTLCLMLFTIPELDVYRQTYGNNAADSCLRMIGAQIAGTFRRAGDLSARIDESTLAVSVAGYEADEAAERIALVEQKARNLGLHNPRGRSGRYVFVQGVAVAADPDVDDVEALIARGKAALESRGDGASQAAAGRGSA
ncbi:MAG TPA: diguanylate cyclase [Gammaproteobacteria bacterium]|nr:diguanylate cyclase [Gammaproteobacteria bacterium]